MATGSTRSSARRTPLRPFRGTGECAILPFSKRQKGAAIKQNLNGRLFQIVDELVRRGVTLDQARREFEKQFIVAALRTNEGNFSRSAKSLGVHRNTLRNKVSGLGIASRDYSAPTARARRR